MTYRLKDGAVIQHLLFKLYHVEAKIETELKGIATKNASLEEMRAEQTEHEATLRAARKEVASAQKEHQKQEKEVRRREKEVEEKKPQLLELQTKIAHAKKKVKTAQDASSRLEKEKHEQEGKVKSLRDELAKAEKTAKQAREDQRKASAARGLTLDEDQLKDYNALKAQAAKKAVKERQELEGLERNARSQKADLTGLEDKLLQAKSLQDKLSGEKTIYAERQRKLADKVKTTEKDLKRKKQEMNDAHAELTKWK